MSRADGKSEAAVIAESAFIAVQLMWIIGVSPFAWILRDGLGPESVTSTGATALVRMFGTFYWGPVCLALLAVDAIWWRRRRNRDGGR